MIKKPITVQISNGLEARPVAMLVQVASQFESKIQVESGQKVVNAKSIMGMMTLGLDSGESVTVCADGSDEEEAINSIEKYLTNTSRQSERRRGLNSRRLFYGILFYKPVRTVPLSGTSICKNPESPESCREFSRESFPLLPEDKRRIIRAGFRRQEARGIWTGPAPFHGSGDAHEWHRYRYNLCPEFPGRWR